VVLPLVVHGEDDSSNTLQEVRASEILIKIQNGEPVEYDHVMVKGDLDPGKLDLPTKYVNRTSFQIDLLGLSETSNVVTSSIRINDSRFDGFVSFNNTILDKPIDLAGSNFTKDAYFNSATFSDDAYFNSATFSGDANFWIATFSGNAYFNSATFSGGGQPKGGGMLRAARPHTRIYGILKSSTLRCPDPLDPHD
jgi:hypothetical protein